jgi:hypothetical protein
MVTFLGYGRHDWGTIHTWLGWVAIFLVVFHLIWNREWLVKIAASGRLARLAAGIFAGLLIGSAFLVLPVEQRDRGTSDAEADILLRVNADGGSWKWSLLAEITQFGGTKKEACPRPVVLRSW